MCTAAAGERGSAEFSFLLSPAQFQCLFAAHISAKCSGNLSEADSLQAM